jgi:hypothetical protein
MGGHSSKNRKEKLRKQFVARQQIAEQLFNHRIKLYSYSYNCSYYDYIEWCKYQYYIDCNTDIRYESYNPPQYNRML